MHKVLYEYRRPAPSKTAGIGKWRVDFLWVLAPFAGVVNWATFVIWHDNTNIDAFLKNYSLRL